MTIINLTQHRATSEQIAQGVVDLGEEKQERLRALLTFDECPSDKDLRHRAREVVRLVPEDVKSAMIGGAPYFMSALENALKERAIEPVYAFSRRESVEEQLPDGTIRKTAIFRHVGFVRPCH